MLPIDPEFTETTVWWLVFGAFCGWLLFVFIDRLFWRDGEVAAQNEQATVAQLRAELEARNNEAIALREELESRQQAARRLAETSEALRDRAATSDQQVVNLEAALSAARQGTAGVGSVTAAGGVTAALAASADAWRDFGAPPEGHGESGGADVRSELADGLPGDSRPAAESASPTNLIANDDGSAMADLPDGASAGPATDPVPPQKVLFPADSTDPAKTLRDALDDADDALDAGVDDARDDEDLFGAPTEILTAFHLHEDDDGFEDSDFLADADTGKLADETRRLRTITGSHPDDGSARTRSPGLARDHSADAFGQTQSMLDRLQSDDPPTSGTRRARAGREEDLSLVNRLRGAFGRRKPDADN